MSKRSCSSAATTWRRWTTTPRASSRAASTSSNGSWRAESGSALGELGERERRGAELVGELKHRKPLLRNGFGAVPRTEQAAGDGGVGVGVVAQPHDVDEHIGQRPFVEHGGDREAERVEHIAGGVVFKEGLSGSDEHGRFQLCAIGNRRLGRRV